MLQKNANPKSNHGKGKPAPSGAFTHRIREDGEVFSSEEGRETSSDTTPLASVAGSVRMRSTDSDRSVRATPKKARDASPPPQDDLWVVVKNLSQQVAAQQAEMDAYWHTWLSYTSSFQVSRLPSIKLKHLLPKPTTPAIINYVYQIRIQIQPI
ncbi:hypothetical protein BASA61_008096 [Batrachochytrium salamandrivorans]|nr:hypothetical protein BASA61_008096 [Batrachochytrium salamandrivorans]